MPGPQRCLLSDFDALEWRSHGGPTGVVERRMDQHREEALLQPWLVIGRDAEALSLSARVLAKKASERGDRIVILSVDPTGAFGADDILRPLCAGVGLVTAAAILKRATGHRLCPPWMSLGSESVTLAAAHCVPHLVECSSGRRTWRHRT